MWNFVVFVLVNSLACIIAYHMWYLFDRPRPNTRSHKTTTRNGKMLLVAETRSSGDRLLGPTTVSEDKNNNCTLVKR